MELEERVLYNHVLGFEETERQQYERQTKILRILNNMNPELLDNVILVEFRQNQK